MDDIKGSGADNDPESGSISDWAELTHGCLINILSRLALSDRWRGPMFVCKSWLNACKDPSLNIAFDLDSQFGSTTDSTRWWTLEFERKIDSMLQSVVDWSGGDGVSTLSEIRVRHCSDFSLNFVAERDEEDGLLPEMLLELEAAVGGAVGVSGCGRH